MSRRSRDYAGLSFLAFCDAFGIPLWPWQREAFGEATRREGGRFVHRASGISVVRGDGKSHGAGAVGLWRLVCGPGRQDIIDAGLDWDGCQVIMDHIRGMVRASPILSEALEIQATSITVKATGSRITTTSREHTTSRGRHADVVILDEGGWARDSELWGSLLAGQASVKDPFALIVSTVGRTKSGPLWDVKTLGEAGHAFWYYRTENQSPLVTPEFLAQQKRILLPGQYRREHENAWVEGADSFTTADQVDAAMGTGYAEEFGGRLDVAAAVFVDIGLVSDPTAIGLGYSMDGKVYLGRLITLQGNREQPVRIEAIEAELVRLCEQWPVSMVRVESWQGVGLAQSLEGLGIPVEVFNATAKRHSEEWPVLAARLAARSVVLFPHRQLREELLGLSYEVGAMGVKVTDRGQVHQDHAVCLRGVAAMLHTPEATIFELGAHAASGLDGFTMVSLGRGRAAFGEQQDELPSLDPEDDEDSGIREDLRFRQKRRHFPSYQ